MSDASRSTQSELGSIVANLTKERDELVLENARLHDRLEEAERTRYLAEGQVSRLEDQIDRLAEWIATLHHEMERTLNGRYTHTRLWDKVLDVLHIAKSGSVRKPGHERVKEV